MSKYILKSQENQNGGNIGGIIYPVTPTMTGLPQTSVSSRIVGMPPFMNAPYMATIIMVILN